MGGVGWRPAVDKSVTETGSGEDLSATREIEGMAEGKMLAAELGLAVT
jgi:hypothetical protein